MENENNINKLIKDTNPNSLINNDSESNKVSIYVDGELQLVPESSIRKSILGYRNVVAPRSTNKLLTKPDKSNQTQYALDVKRVCNTIITDKNNTNKTKEELTDLIEQTLNNNGNINVKNKEIISEFFHERYLQERNNIINSSSDIQSRKDYLNEFLSMGCCFINNIKALDELADNLLDENGNLKNTNSISIFETLYYDTVDESLYIMCNCGKFTKLNKIFAVIEPFKDYRVTPFPIPCIHNTDNGKLNIMGQNLLNALYHGLKEINPNTTQSNSNTDYEINSLTYDDIYEISKIKSNSDNYKKYILDFRENNFEEDRLSLTSSSMANEEISLYDNDDDNDIILFDDEEEINSSSNNNSYYEEESVAISLEEEEDENIDPKDLYGDYYKIFEFFRKGTDSQDYKKSLKIISHFFASIYSDYDFIKRNSIETLILFLESCNMTDVFYDTYIQYPVIEYYRNHLDDNSYYLEFLKNYFSFDSKEETLKYCDYFLDYSKNNEVKANIDKISKLGKILSLLKIKNIGMSTAKYNKYVRDKELYKVLDEISDRMIVYNLGAEYLDGFLSSSKSMKKLKKSLEFSREYEDLIEAFKDFLEHSDYGFKVSKKSLINTSNFVYVFSKQDFSMEVQNENSFFQDLKPLIESKDEFTRKCLQLLKNSFYTDYAISVLFIDILDNLIEEGNIECLSRMSNLSVGFIKSFYKEPNIEFDEDSDLCLLDTIVLDNKFFFEEFNLISVENENTPVLERLKSALKSCNLVIEDVIEEVKNIPLLPDVLNKYKDSL